MAAPLDRHLAPDFVEAPLRYLADDKQVAAYVASVAGGPVRVSPPTVAVISSVVFR